MKEELESISMSGLRSVLKLRFEAEVQNQSLVALKWQSVPGDFFASRHKYKKPASLKGFLPSWVVQERELEFLEPCHAVFVLTLKQKGKKYLTTQQFRDLFSRSEQLLVPF